MNYVQAAAEEFQASREAVTLCDYSSFAKMDLWSAGTEVSRGIYYAKLKTLWWGGDAWWVRKNIYLRCRGKMYRLEEAVVLK